MHDHWAATINIQASAGGAACITAGSARSPERASCRDTAASDATIATVTTTSDVTGDRTVREVTERRISIKKRTSGSVAPAAA
jgi:hypothetical protein